MAGAPERSGHCNVAVGAVGAVAVAQRREGRHLLECKGEVLSRLLIYKTRLLIMEHYGVPELYESGSVVTRLSRAPASARGALHYACLHVDKANIGSYDYSALLYLSDYGADFEGGLFAFCDSDGVDRLVEPRKGRLVAFTSGAENLHQVREVTQGTRHVLAMWFTTSRALGLEVHGAPPAAAAPVTQVSTLGRQKEIQNVLTAMRQDIEEVLAGIRVANFADPPRARPRTTSGTRAPKCMSTSSRRCASFTTARPSPKWRSCLPRPATRRPPPSTPTLRARSSSSRARNTCNITSTCSARCARPPRPPPRPPPPLPRPTSDDGTLRGFF